LLWIEYTFWQKIIPHADSGARHQLHFLSHIGKPSYIGCTDVSTNDFFYVPSDLTGFLIYHGFVTIASSSRIINLD
jgi:hypothetical protein